PDGVVAPVLDLQRRLDLLGPHPGVGVRLKEGDFLAVLLLAEAPPVRVVLDIHRDAKSHACSPVLFFDLPTRPLHVGPGMRPPSPPPAGSRAAVPCRTRSPRRGPRSARSPRPRRASGWRGTACRRAAHRPCRPPASPAAARAGPRTAARYPDPRAGWR